MHVVWLLTFAMCGGTFAAGSAASSAVPQHFPNAQFYDETAREAGATLLDLASRDSIHGRRGLTPYEISKLQECFQLGGESSVFAGFYKDAVRAAVSTRNTDTLRFLHENYPSSDLLPTESDILQLALKTNAERCHSEQYGEADLDTLKILLEYGAPVNGVDADGKTPLFYACRDGWPNVFQVLVDAGADLSVRYAIQVDGWKQRWSKMVGVDEKVSLLQVTANGLYDVWDTEIAGYLRRPQYYYRKWQPIINTLVEYDFTLPIGHPATAIVIELVCAEGTKDEAEMVLSKGIISDAGRGIVGKSISALTPALHAAVKEGRTEMAKLLLKNGADPNATMPYSDRHGVQFRTTPKTAIARACSSRYSEINLLDACEPLLDAGVGKEDQRWILKASIKHGRIDLVERLIEDGVTLIDEVPLTSSLAILKHLRENDFRIDSVKSQEHAVRIGAVDMLAWLVDMYGPQLKDVQRLLYLSSLEDHKHGDSWNMASFLVLEYAHNIDGNFEAHASMGKEVLEYAAWPERHDVLKQILQLGKDSQCPEYTGSIHEMLQSRLGDGPGWSRNGPSREDILLYQTLWRYRRSAEDTNLPENELWLSPSMFDEFLFQELRNDKPIYTGSARIEGLSWRPRDTQWNSSMLLLDTEAGECSLVGEQPVSGKDVSSPATAPIRDKASNEKQRETRKHQHADYAKLPSRDSIRLFLLDPAADEGAPISGSLVDTRLKDKPEYELLSYVVTDINDVVDISVNGMAHSIPRDLHSALMKVRNVDGPRALWVDVICTNQNDFEERSKQASMRKQIIESARSTLIWLGEAADNSHLVFEHVKEWTTYRDDYLAGRRTDNDAFGEAHINPPGYGGDTMEALNRLALRPWFLDVRVVQDLAFSREAYLMCGDHIEDFKMIVLPMSFEIGNGYHPLRGLAGSTHLHLLDELFSSKRGCHVKTVVDYISHCDAPDPRDKVFAVLDFLAKPPMAIDYTLSVEKVYRRFTQAVFEDANDISLLHWLGPRRRIDILPSWVPDYSLPHPGSIFPRVNHFSYIVTETSQLLRHVLPGMRFEGDKMFVRGVQVDTIKNVSEEMIADSSNAPGKPGFINTLSRWESMASQLQDKCFNESISSAFLRTLVAFDEEPEREADKSLSSAHTCWYDRFGSGILREFDEIAFHEADILLEWRGFEYQESREEVDVRHYTHDLEHVVYGRSFFLTESGSMGLAPPNAQPGDSIVYFLGGLYPFVLRSRGDGGYKMVGDCYLYGFDESVFSVEEIERLGEFVLV